MLLYREVSLLYVSSFVLDAEHKSKPTSSYKSAIDISRAVQILVQICDVRGSVDCWCLSVAKCFSLNLNTRWCWLERKILILPQFAVIKSMCKLRTFCLIWMFVCSWNSGKFPFRMVVWLTFTVRKFCRCFYGIAECSHEYRLYGFRQCPYRSTFHPVS